MSASPANGTGRESAWKCVMTRDFPYRLAPTTIVGLFDDSIAVPEIDKLFPDSNKRAFTCRRAVTIRGKTPGGSSPTRATTATRCGIAWRVADMELRVTSRRLALPGGTGVQAEPLGQSFDVVAGCIQADTQPVRAKKVHHL
jgi:hypothetical protein